MASSLIQGAQTIIHCGLCDQENAIWRCIDCDHCICENCKKIHMKVPMMEKHYIVSIAIPLQNIQRKIVIDNIPCQNHPQKMSCLYCKTCDILICSVCIENMHHRIHDFLSMETVVQEKLDQMKLFQSIVAENLQECGSKAQTIDRVKKKYNAIYDNSIAAIKQQEQEMKAAIGRYSSELQDKVEFERSKTEKVMSTLEQQVKEVEKNLEEQKDEIIDILTSSQGKTILESNIKIPDIKSNFPPNAVKCFNPGIGISTHMNQMKECFGMLQNAKTFITDLKCIDQVSAVDETLVWISSVQDKVIKTMELKDIEMTTLKDTPIYCGDIARNSDDDILISKTSGVKLMNKSGEMTSFLTLAPLIPLAIHVTCDDIIISVKEEGEPYILTDKSQRVVIVFGRDGEQKKWYEYNKNGKRLFTFPTRITTNKVNQDILVIDRKSEKTLRVVCVDIEGGLHWTYQGHSPINENKSFTPVGIVATTEGHIIVSDLNVQAVHVLSMEGDVLACQDMTDIGIKYPVSLDIDRKGQLWVGCDQEDEQSKAKLHVIQLLW